MTSIRSDADSVEYQQRLERIQRVARLMDNAIGIPGTQLRLGLDALIGLIPGVGDVAGLVVGLWVVQQARGVGAPRKIQIDMLRNLAIETVLGSVPVLGDLFDVAWQANQRNWQLLDAWLKSTAPPTATPTSPPYRKWVFAGIGLTLLLILIGLVGTG